MAAFYVDYGEKEAPRFASIESLIKYYTVRKCERAATNGKCCKLFLGHVLQLYVQLRRNSKGTIEVDIFPN